MPLNQLLNYYHDDDDDDDDNDGDGDGEDGGNCDNDEV